MDEVFLLMKVRSIDELMSQVSVSSKFRKRELITLSQLVLSGRDHESIVGRRSALTLSYAHWEGFVKDSSQAYISYISSISPSMSNLTKNFQALACKSILCSAARSNKRIASHLLVVSSLVDDSDRSVYLDFSGAIDTESNLNADVFENICLTIGVDYNQLWKCHAPFINDLFKTRCAIAHGERHTPTQDFAKEAIDFVLKSIDDYGDQIINLASLKKFLRAV